MAILAICSNLKGCWVNWVHDKYYTKQNKYYNLQIKGCKINQVYVVHLTVLHNILLVTTFSHLSPVVF